MPLNVLWVYPAFHGSSTPHTTLGCVRLPSLFYRFKMDVFLPTNYPTALQTKIVYCNVKLLMFILSTLAKALLHKQLAVSGFHEHSTNCAQSLVSESALK